MDNCTDQCPATPPADAADELGCACSQLDEDEDGLDDCADECPGTTSGETVDSKGCSCLQLDPDGDGDGDGVLNCFDDCQATIPANTVDDRGCSCLQLDPDRDGDGDGVSDCLDQCMDTPVNTEVGDDGCTIDFAQEAPSTEELPNDDSEINNVDPIAPSDENNLEDSGVSPNRGTPCGLIGFMSLAFLLVGLMALNSRGGRGRRVHAPRSGESLQRASPITEIRTGNRRVNGTHIGE